MSNKKMFSWVDVKMITGIVVSALLSGFAVYLAMHTRISDIKTNQEVIRTGFEGRISVVEKEVEKLIKYVEENNIGVVKKSVENIEDRLQDIDIELRDLRKVVREDIREMSRQLNNFFDKSYGKNKNIK